MSKLPLSTCPITNLTANNSKITSDFYEYKIVCNGNSYTLRLSTEISINNDRINEKVIAFDKLWILRGMLHNNEWPIEEETIITGGLITQLLRFGDYPKNFDEKIDYYALKCYLNGGSEYKPFPKEITKPLDLYAKDRDECDRLLSALFRKNLIEDNVESSLVKKFVLSEKGMAHASELKTLADSKSNIVFPSVTNRPSIIIISTKEDERYVRKLSEVFQKTRAKVVTTYPIDRAEKNISVSSYKQDFQSDKLNYLVFIKSFNSDTNNNYGSVLEVALEIHENTDKRIYNYIYFAFVDDSDIQSRPRLIDYHRTALDIRIKTNRIKLLLAIKEDYDRQQMFQRSKPEDNLPKIIVSDYEKKWLEAVYEKILNNEEFEYRTLLNSLGSIIPNDFDPKEMSTLLLRNGIELTLLGIWLIDENSKILSNFESIAYFIRDVLTSRSNVSTISSQEITESFPGLNTKDVYLVFKLLAQLPSFSTGTSNNNDLSECRIMVDDDQVYQQYRKFNGVKNIIEDQYKNYGSFNKNNTGSKEESVINRFNGGNIDSFKTKYIVRDINDISPVMGVSELANDLAEMIDSLPDEKGQMVGIFGKWGRGKSFLLRELWNNLKNKQIHYIRLDYHAWKYQETPASWAYLYEIFSKEYLGKKNLVYYYKLFMLNKKRHGIWPIIRFLFLVALFLSVSFYIPALLKKYPEINKWYIKVAAFSFLGISFLAVINTLYKEFKVKALDLIKKYSYKNSFKENLGLQADIQDELIKLLKVWIPEIRDTKENRKITLNDLIPSGLPKLGKDKVIIAIKELLPSWWGHRKPRKSKVILFVEDIDRCTEERIIQNIDALRVLLEEEEIAKRVIIITAIDERILKNAIEIKYKAILQDKLQLKKIKELVSEYLDKLFISAVKLGELTRDQKDQYFSELIKQEIDTETMENAFKLSASAYLGQTAIGTNLPKDVETEAGKEQSDENELNQTENFFDNSSNDMRERTDKDSVRALHERNKKLNELKQVSKNTFEKLTAIEIYTMNETVLKWRGATPRKIRIFYYRYLLSKNLLLDKYVMQNRINIWRDKEGIKVLMSLILQYSKGHKVDFISRKKNEIAHSEQQQIDVIIEDKSINVDPQDYLKLLEVLELVVAY